MDPLIVYACVGFVTFQIYQGVYCHFDFNCQFNFILEPHFFSYMKNREYQKYIHKKVSNKGQQRKLLSNS